jgi:hypothetical protein
VRCRGRCAAKVVRWSSRASRPRPRVALVAFRVLGGEGMATSWLEARCGVGSPNEATDLRGYVSSRRLRG